MKDNRETEIMDVRWKVFEFPTEPHNMREKTFSLS